MSAAEHARRLTALTERLTERLAEETRCFEARRPQDVAAGVAETQDMANLYRRETARVKADRSSTRRRTCFGPVSKPPASR